HDALPICCPVTTLGLSTPPIVDPRSVKFLGSLSLTESSAGTGRHDAFATYPPHVIDRPEGGGRTRPPAATHSPAGAPLVWAAASTGIVRAVAPIFRSAA